ncbi:MAG TPA: hypothetical protein VK196_07865, partial [Magnetospirillum sp.]|nr:hypothetical protein [Magnetospirillum sp.]
GFGVQGGWAVGPLVVEGAPRFAGPFRNEQVQALCHELGVEAFGADQINVSDTELRTRIWQPLLPTTGLRPADKWAAIHHAAWRNGDGAYARLCRNLSASLRAADIRLRDASDEYHRQLRAALKSGAKPNLKFKNIALTDLHLAFHSLLAEMASARDYVSAVAGLHIGAPEKKSDSLARLMEWTEAASRRHHRAEPFVAALAAGWDEASSDRWLYDLGEYRNLFLHREPMGTGLGVDGVFIAERPCQLGVVRTLRMEIPVHQDASQRVEALERFLYLYRRLLELLGRLADQARYPAEVPHFVAG